MTARTAGTLNAADLGKPTRIEWEGWVHTGALDFVKHDRSTLGRVTTFLGVRAENNARWMQHVPVDHPIEMHDDEEDDNPRRFMIRFPGLDDEPPVVTA